MNKTEKYTFRSISGDLLTCSSNKGFKDKFSCISKVMLYFQLIAELEFLLADTPKDEITEAEVARDKGVSDIGLTIVGRI